MRDPSQLEQKQAALELRQRQRRAGWSYLIVLGAGVVAGAAALVTGLYSGIWMVIPGGASIYSTRAYLRIFDVKCPRCGNTVVLGKRRFGFTVRSPYGTRCLTCKLDLTVQG